MCQRNCEDLPLTTTKKQLEELWKNTESLICILKNNCKYSRDALKPIIILEKEAISSSPDHIVLTEKLEEKLCEKIDKVINFTHSAVEKSKGCLVTVNCKLKKKPGVTVASTVQLPQSASCHTKEDESNSTLKSNFGDRIKKSTSQSRIDFLKTTYSSAFVKPKKHSNERANKVSRVCTTRNSREYSDHSSKKIDACLFDNIGDLLEEALSSKNENTDGKSVQQISSTPQMFKSEFKLDEAISKRFIKPHNDLVNLISSYHKNLARLSTKQTESTHQSRFLEELKKRNQLHSSSLESLSLDLEYCFNLIDRCPIRQYDAKSPKSSNSSHHEISGCLLLTYNDSKKWMELETKKLEIFFLEQYIQLLKRTESIINDLSTVKDKASSLKTLTSLTSILPGGSSR